MPGPLAVAAIPAAISVVGSLFGAKKGSNAAKDAAKVETDYAAKALEEQRRAFDLTRADEQAKLKLEQERYNQSRADIERERANTERDRASRANTFAQYGNGMGGTLPNAFGASNEQMAQFRQGMSPQGGAAPQGAPAPQANAGSSAFSFHSEQPSTDKLHSNVAGMETVLLRAPTGEEMEVSLDQAPALIRKGAVMILKKASMNAFSVPMQQQGVA